MAAFGLLTMPRNREPERVTEIRQFLPAQESCGSESPWVLPSEQISTALRRDTAGETATIKPKNINTHHVT